MRYGKCNTFLCAGLGDSSKVHFQTCHMQSTPLPARTHHRHYHYLSIDSTLYMSVHKTEMLSQNFHAHINSYKSNCARRMHSAIASWNYFDVNRFLNAIVLNTKRNQIFHLHINYLNSNNSSSCAWIVASNRWHNRTCTYTNTLTHHHTRVHYITVYKMIYSRL